VLQDGLLVRDLQLPLGHKYAFLLRPLPTRAQVRALARVCRRDPAVLSLRSISSQVQKLCILAVAGVCMLF